MEYYQRNKDALDAEHSKDKNTEAGNDDIIYTLRKGRTVLRVLPPFSADGVWFREMTEYYFKIGDEHYFLTSPRDFGLPDPLWDWGRSIYQEGDEAAIKEAKRFRPKTKYLMNVLILSDPDQKTSLESGIKVLKAPTTVRRALVGYDYESEWGDITNPENGFNMSVEREGEKLNTKYSVIPGRERSNIFQALMDIDINPQDLNLPDLDAVHRGALRSNDELQGILEQIKGVARPKSQAPRQSFGGPVAQPAAATPAPVEPQVAATPAPQQEAPQAGPIASPVMQAPEGAPATTGLPQPPTQGGE